MMVEQIFTKIGNFIQNRQIFMLLNCNCAKLANLWPPYVIGQAIYIFILWFLLLFFLA